LKGTTTDSLENGDVSVIEENDILDQRLLNDSLDSFKLSDENREEDELCFSQNSDLNFEVPITKS